MFRFLLIGVVLALAACQTQPHTLRISGETMGASYNVVAVDHSSALSVDKMRNAVEAALALVNAQMSNWDPTSEVSQFNAFKSTQPFEISDALAKVMAAAQLVHAQSDGQFDITLSPLIELWGFGARRPGGPTPTPQQITQALRSTGQSRLITLRPGAPAQLVKQNPNVEIHVAAIAKGYGVDEVGKALTELGLSDFMVEIGGDLLTSGVNPDGGAWRIGIERPDTSGGVVEQVIAFSGLGMATSGDYRNYFEQNGVRYTHILNATTGRPITHNTASVTVLAPSAMMADAWATALLALGREKGLALSEQLNLATLFIVRDPALGAGKFVSTASARFKEIQQEAN